MDPLKQIKKYSRTDLDINEAFVFIKNIAIVAGKKIIYMALLLYFTLRRKDVPKWTKSIILGSIAYLLAPIDLVPDLTPILGFTDDLTVLMYGIISVATYIDKDVKSQAKEVINKWFGKQDEETFSEVDEKL